MIRPQQNRLLQVTALAILLGLLASLSLLWLEPARFLAGQLHRQLESVPDEQLEPRLEQLLWLGDEGLRQVVEALDDDRRAVADAARRVLGQQLDQWQSWNVKDSSPRVATLARLLARQSGRSGPAARQVSADLAQRILLWPIDRSRVDGSQLVADCETVLRAAVSRVSRSSQAAGSRGIGVESAVQEQATGQRVPPAEIPPLAANVAPAPMAPLTDDELPFEIAASVSPPRIDPAFEQEDFEQEDEQDSEQRSLPLVATAAAESETKQDLQDTAAEAPGEEPEPAGELFSAAAEADGPERPGSQDSLRSLAVVEVMKQLQGARPADAERYTQELLRRGFQPIHIRLAQQLFDPDPAVRKQLVEALPRMAGVDARPWLLWLSRDTDTAVRHAAITVIATSADATLRSRLEEIAQEETDPEILRQVRRVLYPSRRR